MLASECTVLQETLIASTLVSPSSRMKMYGSVENDIERVVCCNR
jgi:hypothetical protein